MIPDLLIHFLVKIQESPILRALVIHFLVKIKVKNQMILFYVIYVFVILLIDFPIS